MPQWIIDRFGPSLAQFVWVALVAAVVCVLAVVVIVLGKRLFANGSGLGPRAKTPRLQVVDIARIDDKRKLVLLRRDEVEHLILVGGQTDILVEGPILRVPAAARPVATDNDSYIGVPAAAVAPHRRPEPMLDPGDLDRKAVSHPTGRTVTPPPEAAPRPVSDSRSKTGSQRREYRDEATSRIEPQIAAAPAPSTPKNTEPQRQPRPVEVPSVDRPVRDAPEPSQATAPSTPRRTEAVAAPVPAPVAPVAPVAPKLAATLNPSTLAFSRATPTVSAGVDVVPPLTARPVEEASTVPIRREPAATTAPRAALAATPLAENGDGIPKTRGPDDQAQPLSVRSFASAIQNRRYSRIEDQRRTDAAKSAAIAGQTPGRATAPDNTNKTDDLAALDRSLDEFFSAELETDLQNASEVTSKAEVGILPATPASPRSEPSERTNSLTTPKDTAASEAVPDSPPSRTTETLAKPAAAVSEPAQPATPRPVAASLPAEPKARQTLETQQASSAALPDRTVAQPLPRAPAVPSEAPAPQAPKPRQAPEISLEAGRGGDANRSPQEVNLEEEMKRLLGELDVQSSSHGSKP